MIVEPYNQNTTESSADSFLSRPSQGMRALNVKFSVCSLVSSSDLSEDGPSVPFHPITNQEPIESSRINLLNLKSSPTAMEKSPTEPNPNGPVSAESVTFHSEHYKNNNDNLSMREHVDITPRR